jgi:predicted ATPase/transcriptional regulator with XRE-family HTH domain
MTDIDAAPDSAALGARLRRYRVDAGLTQAELAEQSGLSVRAISDLERGVRRFPYPDTLERYTRALKLGDVERDDLLRTRHRRVPANQPRVDIRQPADGVMPSYPPSAARRALIGRERELAGLSHLLREDQAAVITLVGPGGVGKTRLAAEVARSLADCYRDGAHWVDLGPLARPELVVQAVAQAVRLRIERDRDPLTALLSYLSSRHLLLVIDNCEHLIAASANLASDILDQCSDVRILATSREPLGIQAEVVWRLGSLDEAASVELFVARAREQRREFVPEDPSTILLVCRTLDHLPLAIELAAARSGLLAPPEILERLEDRFTLLKRVGARDVIPRQQTLQATVDWSYHLLEPGEQQLFRRLAVFAGAFDVSAATAMVGVDALDVLARLVDKSLVVADVGERSTRYRLLDTLRSYAWERLRDTDEVTTVRQRHLEYFLTRAESLFRVSEIVDGPTRVLDANLNDLRLALEWCAATDAEAGLRLIGATRPVWFRRDCAEGRQWAERFLARCPDATRARACVLLAVGELNGMGDTTRARGALAEAIENARKLQDNEVLIRSTSTLATIARLEEQPLEALACITSVLGLAEAFNDPGTLGVVLVELSLILLTQPDRHDEARELVGRVRALGAGPTPNRYTVAMADYADGTYLRRHERPGPALERFRATVRGLHLLGESAQLCFALFEVGRLMADTAPIDAALVLSAAISGGQRVGVNWRPRLLRAVERVRAGLAPVLGVAHLEELWAKGERLSLDEAVALALDEHVTSVC